MHYAFDVQYKNPCSETMCLVEGPDDYNNLQLQFKPRRDMTPSQAIAVQPSPIPQQLPITLRPQNVINHMRAVPLQQLSPSPTPSILSSFNASRTPGAEEMETMPREELMELIRNLKRERNELIQRWLDHMPRCQSQADRDYGLAPLAVRLNALINAGKFPPKSFLFFYLEQVCHHIEHIESRPEWHPDLYDVADSIERIGGTTLYHFLRGPGQLGQGKLTKTFDLTNFLFPLPSISRLQARSPAWTVDPGVYRCLLLNSLRIAFEPNSIIETVYRKP